MSVKAILLLALVAGCQHGGGDDDVSAGEGEGEPGEGEPGEGEGEDACPVGLVPEMTGTLLADDGAAIEGATVGLCLRADQGAFDTFVCLRPVETDAVGGWQVAVPERLQCVRHATVRLAAPGHATTYCVVPVDGADGSSVEAPPYGLVAMPPDPPAWSGEEPIELVADDGATVTMRPSDLDDTQDPAAVRFRRVDIGETRPCFLPEGEDVLALYVLEPEAPVVAETGLPAILQAPGADEGDAVSLRLLGGLHTTLAGELVQEGDWVPFAESEVGPDGAVSTPEGAGLPQLGWFGVVRTP